MESVCGVCEGTSGRTNNSILREIEHKKEREVKASEEIERTSLGGLLMSFSEEWSKKRGGSGEQTIASLSICFCLFPPFSFFMVTSHLT